MNVYEVEVYLNGISGTDTQQFLADNWGEAVTKAQVIFNTLKKGEAKLKNQVRMVRLELKYRLSEI